MDGETLLPLLRGVASGMAFLHAHDPPIVHADLKSSNVLVSGWFQAKVKRAHAHAQAHALASTRARAHTHACTRKRTRTARKAAGSQVRARARAPGGCKATHAGPHSRARGETGRVSV